ncbi:signal transduction histidine kinase [Saccharopolyspora erythraea NRRL 2338]|uniref:histidine kinase n=2 Tax=Saccharopolyspora erythraea TaxID=1836 RepID=A4FDI6_SACEN|nr:HAMP domain-containing sensor histidine kinase [Saccharopolyspora erythraea]EQD82080.1 histidine kinase [Saccharopolyspora erythraea D]PFG95850.1 signal transduction histidine kinase [Saccharopolyspora erythraea NRRL 2338]QRK92428.1 HAMP domain-containing histidine kinase [Saccharopolyspora erythraea]CAM02111.1 two-component system sensor kinase [Saccharopolyspora erythraea NRRL 2338]
MRARITALLLTLVACLLLALSVPLALSTAARETEGVFLDRLNDTERFAGLAEQATTDVDLPWLAGELARYQQVYGITAAVLDRDGAVRTGSSPPGPSIAADPAVRAALAGRRSEAPRWVAPWQPEPLVVAVPVLRAGDVVGAAVTISPTTELRQRVAWWWALVAGGALVAVVVCTLLTSRLARWVLRPVHDLDAVAHDIAQGRFDARVGDAGGPPELRRLTTSFNDMADAVQTSWQRQRSFVSDASHQLRNPLSALLLRQQALEMDLPPELREDWASAQEEGRRLHRVLDELLALATAEQSVSPPAEISLGDLVDERIASWQPAAGQRGIGLERTGADDVRGFADPTALGSALDAVLDNAIKFSPEGGRVVVDVGTSDEDAVITVLDEGPGLAADELDRIGNRFWRSPRHQNVEGSGLGVSIAKALLASFGGALEARNRERRGLAVAVRVPVPPDQRLTSR